MGRPLALAALSLLSLSSPARAAWVLNAGTEVIRAFSSHGFLTAQNNAAQAIIQADGNPVSEEERLRGVWAGFGPVPRGPALRLVRARVRDLSRWGDYPPNLPMRTHLTLTCPRGWGLVDGQGRAGGLLRFDHTRSHMSHRPSPTFVGLGSVSRAHETAGERSGRDFDSNVCDSGPTGQTVEIPCSTCGRMPGSTRMRGAEGEGARGQVLSPQTFM